MKRFLLFFLVFTLLILLFPIQNINAQPWYYEMSVKKASGTSFFDVQKAFNDYWAPYNVEGGYYTDIKGVKRKASGWKQYKRWEWYWKSRVDNVTGKFPLYSRMDALEKWKTENISKTKSTNKSVLGNWQPLGPSNVSTPDFGTGRINCLTFDPTNTNRFWVGAPGGGVWLTENNGGSWTCLTDNNPVLGVSVIELHPEYDGTTNTTIYIATGDRTVMDNPSVGILKSTDDGTSWQETGFSAGPGEGMTVGGLRVNPSNPDIILVGASTGLYRSTDGGNSWILKQSGNFIDMEKKPGSSTVYYASTYGWDPTVYKTDDAGDTWTLVRTITGHFRCEIAVTDADPNYVYIITSLDAYESGNIERSTDSGDNWTVMYTNTDNNLFGWETDYSGGGGQGFYDIAIAVSSIDRDELYIGGVISFLSTNGGASFSPATCWTTSTFYNHDNSPIIHADHHNAYYHPVSNRLYDVNDGGIHYSDNVTSLSSATWTDITGGLANGQIYGIGVSQQNSDETVAGFQDNGTKLLASGTSLWDDVKGGDGMHCDIDVTTNLVQYGTYTNLQVDRTTNGWGSSSSIRGSGGADWAGPLEGDPLQAGIIYIGTDAVERYNGSWSDMSTSLNNSTYLLALEVHNDGTNLVIYTADNSDLWRSNTSGTSFVSVKNNLPSNMVTDIAVDYSNPTTTAWVTLGGYDANNVYMTTDNGASWTDISEGLPELPCNTIVQNRQNTIENELYVGTDVGVYVKLGNAPWQLFGEGLPNVVVTDLEIYYDATPANTIIRTATYGRGTWESDIYTPPSIDASISAISEPVSEYCNLGNFTPTFTLANIGTTTLTSADISYSINGGAAVNQAWSGSLVQGATTSISFPVEALSYGTHEIIVTVSNPNASTDENASNNTYTEEYKVWNNSMPFTQNFDNFINGGNTSSYGGEAVALSECWENEDEGGVDWSVNSGATGSTGTGPSGDHTSGSGNYLYTETSTTGGNIAYASSPTIDLSMYSGCEMTFWYHMYGLSGGTIWVDLFYDGTWHTGVSVDWNGTVATSVSGDQGDIWLQATVNISAADGFSDFKGRIRADVTASDYLGDMAFDDVAITGTIACTQPTSQASNFATTPDFTTMDISWDRGDGDNVLIVAREGSAVDTDPDFNTSYAANTVFGSGNEIGTGNFVVYNGTGTNITITGLTDGTDYHFALYEYNNTDVCYLTPGLISNNTTLTLPPSISEIIPDNFYADLGKQLSVSGANFNNLISVVLGGITGSVISNNGSTIVVDFPAGNYSDNTLVVTNGGGTDNSTCTVNTRNIIPVGSGTDSHTTISSALDGLYAWWGTTVFDANKIIDVYTGTYTETVTPNVSLNTTVANMLVIQAHTDDTPVINATGNTNGVYIGDLNYVKLEGFTVYGATDDNIYTEGDYNQISFNRCYGSTAGSGIKLSAGNNSIITSNLLYSNYNYGLHLVSSDNLTVKNNTVYDNGYSVSGGIEELFFEGWESGSGAWTMNSWTISTTSPRTGLSSARLNRRTNEVLEHTSGVNITGKTNVNLSCWAIDGGALEAGDMLKGEYQVDNLGWVEFFNIVSVNSYTEYTNSVTIPTGNTLYIRFTGTNDRNQEFWYIDDIQVTADTPPVNNGAGLYVESGTSINLENNIFVAKTGTEYLALKTETGTSITTDYNNYFKEAGNTNLVNYLGVDYIDFSSWPNEGTNDLESDPLFVNAGTDFHLQSTFGSFQAGQWPPISAIAGTWTNDASISPAIDAGNADAFDNEPALNGSIINLGCYGNTQQASKTGNNGGTAGLWTGAISTNWVVSGNWDDGNVPIESSNVVIPNVAQLPVIDANAVCNDLTINASSVLTIDVTGYLIANGTLTNNASSTGLIINSSEIGDGALTYNNTGINATVQRFLDAPPSATQWHYVSSPITAAPVALFSVDFYDYDESTDDWWTDATLYGTSGWNAPTGNLIPLNGYIFNNSETTVNFEGELNFIGGDYDVNITYTEHTGDAANDEPYSSFDAWNLVGNPYTSELDWDLITKTNVDATIYYYDDLAHNYAYYIDGVGSVNGGSRYIPSMQGFFVKASSAAGGTLTIPLSARVHTGQSLFKEASETIINNSIKLSVSDKVYNDEILIILNDKATLLFDNKLDAYKRFSWDSEIPQIYSLNSEKKFSYAINSLPESSNQHIIPLGFRFASAGNYILNVTEFNFADYHVFLENTFTNNFISLRDLKEISIEYDDNSKVDRYQMNIFKNNAPFANMEISDQEIELNTNYEFTIEENTFSDIDLNDKLSYITRLSDGSSLPLWLNFNDQNLSFTGTPTEVQVLDIEVEAKDLLGATVSSTYKLSVKSTTGLNELIEDKESEVCKVYPNPNKGKFIIEVDHKYDLIQYEIISMTGKVMKKAEIKNGVSNYVDISGMANGTYILNLILDNELEVKKSIVIEY